MPDPLCGEHREPGRSVTAQVYIARKGRTNLFGNEAAHTMRNEDNGSLRGSVLLPVRASSHYRRLTFDGFLRVWELDMPLTRD